MPDITNAELAVLLRKIYKVLLGIFIATVIFTSIEVAEAFFAFEGWDLL